MDQILGKEILDFTTVYVDDLLIVSDNWKEHCYRVERVSVSTKQYINIKTRKIASVNRQPTMFRFHTQRRRDYANTRLNKAYSAIPYSTQHKTVTIIS